MSKFVVHSVPGSPYGRAVLATLEEKRGPYRFAPVAPGTLRSPEHLARHPFGRVPALEHDGLALYETQAILRYLDRVLPAPALTPGDAKAAARMDQAMNICDWYLFQGVSDVIGFQRIVRPRLTGLPADEAAIAQAMPKARAVIEELARLLGEQHYFAGAALSLAGGAHRFPGGDAGMGGSRRAAGQPRRLARADEETAKPRGHDLGARRGHGQGCLNKGRVADAGPGRSAVRPSTSSEPENLSRPIILGIPEGL